MFRDFDITVRHENGTLLTSVALLPDSPNKKRISASSSCKDTEIAAAFKAEGVETAGGFIGKEVEILVADLMELDGEGKANK